MPNPRPPAKPPQNAPAARPRSGLSSIRVKLFLAPFLVCCMLVGLGAFTIYSIQEGARMTRAALDGLDRPADLAAAVRDGFSRMVRLADTAVPQDEPRRQIQLQAVEALCVQLDISLRAIPLERASTRTRNLIADIRAGMAGWWQAYKEGLADGIDADERRHLDGLAAATQDGLRTLVGSAEADSRTLHAAAARADRSSIAVAGAVAVLLVLTLIVARLLGRDILGPIDAAADVARRIADGNLDTKIPPCGPDETGALLTALGVMQASLRAQVDREVALRESAQSRLLEAIDNSSEAIILVSANDEILLSNDQTAAYFPTLRHLFQPSMRFSDALRRAAASGAILPVQRGPETLVDRFLDHPEIRRVVGDVQVVSGRWLRMSFSRTPQGETVAIWSDITEIKEREEAMRAARDEAEKASRAKSSFLASISHELRTPLNAIIGFSEIIEQELLGPVGTPEYRQYADDILNSGRHLLKIINDVLDLSKSETGALSINLAPVEIGQVVEACRRMMRDQCERAGLTMEVALEPDLPWVDADAGRLKQILLNLMSNAVKFTDKGGRIEIAATEREGGVAVAVSDTGIGMTPEEIAVALEPFGQVDGNLNRRYDGTGLGLPLSRTLVELHGGRLTMDSRPGVGTCVTVVLPAPAIPAVPAVSSA